MRHLKSAAFYAYLTLAVLVLYAGSVTYPLVFDDLYNHQLDPRYMAAFKGNWLSDDMMRGFYYSTFLWTYRLFGPYLEIFRLENIALHLANAFLLFSLLRRVFDVALGGNNEHGDTHKWLALLGAGWFALNPAAVYAVTYLVQRSMLLMTLFGLLAMHAWLSCLCAEDYKKWLWAGLSVAYYLLAVMSKEHAVILPLLLLPFSAAVPHSLRVSRKSAIGLCLLIASAGLLLFVRQSYLGRIGEGHAAAMLSMQSVVLGSDIAPKAHLLSVITQGWLYFKYLLLWIIPNPLWMSIDLHPPFATAFWSWPQSVGLLLFCLWPILGIRLLLKKGKAGLAGLAMLWPWLLFLTEMSTVRVQEIFVLYRSYLWMAGLPFALPLLLSYLPRRIVILLAFALPLVLLPFAFDRVLTFANPYRLWNDAVMKNDLRPNALNGRAWMYRGMALMQMGRLDEALADVNQAIALDPWFAEPYGNRAVIYMRQAKFPEALADCDIALKLSPSLEAASFNKRLILEALKKQNAP